MMSRLEGGYLLFFFSEMMSLEGGYFFFSEMITLEGGYLLFF